MMLVVVVASRLVLAFFVSGTSFVLLLGTRKHRIRERERETDRQTDTEGEREKTFLPPLLPLLALFSGMWSAGEENPVTKSCSRFSKGAADFHIQFCHFVRHIHSALLARVLPDLLTKIHRFKRVAFSGCALPHQFNTNIHAHHIIIVHLILFLILYISSNHLLSPERFHQTYYQNERIPN